MCKEGKHRRLSLTSPTPGDIAVKMLMQETWVQSLGQEDSLKKEMATHSSTPTWEIPRTEESSRIQFQGVSKQTDIT